MLQLKNAESIYSNHLSGDTERTCGRAGSHQGPVALLTKIIPHSSGRDFCTNLAPLCPRQNLVHYKQLEHAHAELLGTEAQ